MTAVLFLLIAAAAAAQSGPVGSAAGTGSTATIENAPGQTSLAWYTGLSPVRGRTADVASAVFQARVALGYTPGDSSVLSLISERRPLLGNLLLSFLTSRTAEQLARQHEAELEQALLAEVNRAMGSAKVRAVKFVSLDLTSP